MDGKEKGLSKCVVCGRTLTPNHKCPASVEGAWQAAQTRANQAFDMGNDCLAADRRWYGSRLAEGFAALEGLQDATEKD